MAGDLLLRTETDGQVQELYDRPGAPELYVDGFHGFFAAGATIKLNLFTRAFQPSAVDGAAKLEVDRRELAARLVMGVDTFFSVVEALNRVASNLKSHLESNQSAGVAADAKH
jgi:hypothetical protein